MPPKLRGDAAEVTSRRSGRYVATQRAVHRDAVGDTSGQGCTRFGTRMHVIRDNYCFSEKNVVSLHCVRRKAALGKVQASLTLLSFALSLHCHSLRTANEKLTTKKRRGKRQGCTPAQSLSKCWTIKKRKEKENEKGSLENYLAGDYRRTYCRRHYARRYQLHVNWFV